MVELEKSTTKTYFPRYKMHLKIALNGQDIEEDFTCKWEVLEKTFYNAIGKEHNIDNLWN